MYDVNTLSDLNSKHSCRFTVRRFIYVHLQFVVLSILSNSQLNSPIRAARTMWKNGRNDRKINPFSFGGASKLAKSQDGACK